MRNRKFTPVGETIRSLRIERGFPLRRIVSEVNIDTSLLGKIERGERRTTKAQLLKIANLFDIKDVKLTISCLREKLSDEIASEEHAQEILEITKELSREK